MLLEAMERVLAVIAEIEQNQFIMIDKEAPERVVAVDREPVAVAEREPRPARSAVLTQANHRPVLHDDLDGLARCGNLETQCALQFFEVENANSNDGRRAKSAAKSHGRAGISSARGSLSV